MSYVAFYSGGMRIANLFQEMMNDGEWIGRSSLVFGEIIADVLKSNGEESSLPINRPVIEKLCANVYNMKC